MQNTVPFMKNLLNSSVTAPNHRTYKQYAVMGAACCAHDESSPTQPDTRSKNRYNTHRQDTHTAGARHE